MKKAPAICVVGAKWSITKKPRSSWLFVSYCAACGFDIRFFCGVCQSRPLFLHFLSEFWQIIGHFPCFSRRFPLRLFVCSSDDMAQGDSESIKTQAPIETDFFHDFIILHVSFPCFNWSERDTPTVSLLSQPLPKKQLAVFQKYVADDLKPFSHLDEAA